MEPVWVRVDHRLDAGPWTWNGRRVGCVHIDPDAFRLDMLDPEVLTPDVIYDQLREALSRTERFEGADILVMTFDWSHYTWAAVVEHDSFPEREYTGRFTALPQVYVADEDDMDC